MLVTVLFGSIYAAGQYILRSGANDPQIQLAYDAAQKLDANTDPKELVSGRVDLSSSLAPFMIVYDTGGRVLASSGYLGSGIPELPDGVLENTAHVRDNRFTWQPRPQVRIATVIVAAQHGFVLSGRSLREVEDRETELERLLEAAWLLSIIVLGATYAVSTSAAFRNPGRSE